MEKIKQVNQKQDKLKTAFSKIKKDMNYISDNLEKTKASKRNFEIEIVNKFTELSQYLKNQETRILKKTENEDFEVFREDIQNNFSELKTYLIDEIAKVYDRMYNEFVDLKLEIKNIREEADLKKNVDKKTPGLFSKKIKEDKKEKIEKINSSKKKRRKRRR